MNKDNVKVEFIKDDNDNLSYRIKALWFKGGNRFTGSSTLPYTICIFVIKEDVKTILHSHFYEFRPSCRGLLSFDEEKEVAFTFKNMLDYNKSMKYRLDFAVDNTLIKSFPITLEKQSIETNVIEILSSDNEAETELQVEQAKRKRESVEKTERKKKKEEEVIEILNSEDETETESAVQEEERTLKDLKTQKDIIQRFKIRASRLIKTLKSEMDNLEKGVNEAIEESENKMDNLEKGVNEAIQESEKALGQQDDANRLEI